MAAETVTLAYLFSDLEGSTRLWERFPDAMHAALARHDAILLGAVEAAGGRLVKMTGDGLMAVFDQAADAVEASLVAQRGLAAEPWGETGPLRVRIGMHVGESQARAGDYYGTAVNRAARIMAAGHGGQVLLSAPTADELTARLPDEVTLRDLGTHRLKDLGSPEQLFQLCAPGLEDTFAALATLDVRPNNLPTQTSSFLGREDTLAELRSQIDGGDARLITLIGPGGTGKTRLGLQVAADQVDRFADGVFLVDVSAEREPDGVYAAIARTVGVGGPGEDLPLQALQNGLRDRQLLLLLDNMEQVTAAGPGLVEVLRSGPGVKLLVTSREALRVRGEQLFPVPPLTLPQGNGSLGLDDAMESEAVQLFLERAMATRPDFTITADNVADVVAICRRLDGLPLAVELAAARINLFDVAELRTRLDRHLDVLKGARDLPERQQTLRRAIEWSNDLLNDDERIILRLFAVFVGARLADVEATTSLVPACGDLDVLEGLSSLVDKSLVRSVRDPDGRLRFSMLQTIRDYATEELAADPELAATIHAAHADHYTGLAGRLRERLARADRREVLSAFGEEVGNFRAAWRHWVDTADIARLHELLEPLWGYYDALGDYAAASDLGNDLLRILRLQPESAERVRDEIAIEMSLARSLIAVRGYTAEVEQTILSAVERSRGAGMPAERFPVLRSLATMQMMRADFSAGAEVGRELLAIAEESGDPALLADAHVVMGAMHVFTDLGLPHLEQAIEHFDVNTAGLARFRVGPSPGVVANVVSGLLLWTQGYPDAARHRSERGLQIARQLAHPYSLAYALHHAALLDLWRGDLESVRQRAEEQLRVANANDYPIWRALATVLLGTAMVGGGDHDAGLAQVDRGFDLYAGLSTPPVFWPLLLGVRAVANMLAGRVEQALVLLGEAEAASQEGDPDRADLALLRGDLLMASTPADPGAALAEYERALELATFHKTRMTQLQAATRLAGLQQATAQGGAALDRLREIHAMFTEGFDAPPVVAARAVLEAAPSG